MNMIVSFLFHLTAFSAYAFTIYYDLRYIKSPFPQTFGGRWKFLTFWDLVFQVMFFGIALVCDVILIKKGSNHLQAATSRPGKNRLHSLRDTFFASTSFPLAIFVAAVFWGLYSIDRELIFPKILDEVFPSWLNHLMHTLIVPTCLIENCLIPRRYPTKKRGITCLTMVMLVYMCWTFVVAYLSNVWTYPILQVLNWWQRACFFIIAYLLVLGCYYLGHGINKACWSSTLEKPKERRNKKK